MYDTLILFIFLIQIASNADSNPMDMNCSDIAIQGSFIITIHVKECGVNGCQVKLHQDRQGLYPTQEYAMF